MPTQINVTEDSGYTYVFQFAGGGTATKTVQVDDPPVGGKLYYTRSDAPNTYILLGTGVAIGERNVTIYFKPDADFAGDAGLVVLRSVFSYRGSVDYSYFDFTIAVSSVPDVPRAITLSNYSVAENDPGAGIGVLGTTDPDLGDYHTYSIVGDLSGKFEISGGTLRLKAGQSLDYEAQSSFTVRVRTIDSTNRAFEQNLTITVINRSEIFLGSAGVDELIGTAGDDDLRGLDGNDIMLGLAGQDDLDGGPGNDFLFGGDNDDDLIGGSGNDMLNGGAGKDRMEGGTGDDYYYVDASGDTVIETAGAGFDTVETSVSGYALPANVERLIYTGVANVTLTGNDGDNDLTGGSGADIIVAGGGTDTLSGGGGIDGFYLGGSLTPADTIDGGASNDILGLQGTYANYVFSASNLIGIELLMLLPGNLTTYSGGPGTARHSYHLTTIDANVAAGQTFVVNAANLLADETLYFNGSAETNGSFFIFGGSGNDTLIGGSVADIFASGLGRDMLTGGGGNDIFYFRLPGESPPDLRDMITDFTGGDRIHLSAFGQNLSQGLRFIDGAAFSGVAGQVRVDGSGTGWRVEIDTDGDGDADFALDVRTNVSGYDWNASDFVL